MSSTQSNYCSTVKCSGCNLVICEVLSFIQNKMDVMDVESLIRVCVSGFSAGDIEQAKSLLFESVPNKKRKTSKRRDGKAQKEVEDIICFLRETDPEKIPIFVSRDLQKLPPVSFDHVDVTSLLKDLLILKADVKNIKETYLLKEDYLKMSRNDQAKVDLNICSPRVDYVNKRRGAYLSDSFVESGPIGLQHISLNNVTVNESADECAVTNTEFLNVSNSKRTISVSPRKASAEAAQLSEKASVVSEVIDKPVSRKTSSCIEINEDSCCKQINFTHVNENVCKQQVRELAVAEIVSTRKEVNKDDRDNEWQEVRYGKKKYNRFFSNKGNASCDLNSKFKAAESKVPLYISNVSKSTEEADIVEYIWNKTQELVTLEKLRNLEGKNYNSFKLYVPIRKLPLFLKEEIWPEGISFRRFVLFKNVSVQKLGL